VNSTPAKILISLWAIFYTTFIVYHTYIPLDDFRVKLRIFDSKLGIPIPEKSYSANCDISLSTFISSCDHFIFYHAIGWFLFAGITQNTGMAFLLSLQDEVIEITFKSLLPNFKECWWDSLIIDVLITNALGIFLVRLFLKYYLFLPEFKWINIEIPFIKQALFIIPLMAYQILRFLSPFMIKYILWIQSSHWIFIYLTFIYALIVMLSVQEHYRHYYSKKTLTIMDFYWRFLAIITISADFNFFFTVSKRIFNTSYLIPIGYYDQIAVAWMLYITLLATVYIYRIRQQKNNLNCKVNSKILTN